MGGFSAWHWAIVLVVILIFFGRGKVPELMGDVAQGIRAFKRGLRDDQPTDGELDQQDKL
ncbi:twin-arginine translocase TatA/TatE family subunit [Rhizobium leguminosarum]|uniref:twin-arginine translocase TatA/TatE family subunit n=1 Tax=Rhizobium leguminosarum TaxID=384 RepID=UPI00144233C1|nr:twin-arginine translocase TatA/TatE family subunit [Rhizobium leguminosarum]MBY5814638.1 twin-arginine translocase TatA/TatE family subunit [Rhizobium leguminosarum]NKL78187.1 twin-arginine translocase TatA/TatE family subunit [Rhizobium leguminosarum bv. viciae]